MNSFEGNKRVPASLFQAPGRVNLIGEHTDYNDGFVLPVSIQLRTKVSARALSARKLHIRSEFYSEDIDFDLDETNGTARKHWSDYVLGVTMALAREGFNIPGADLLITSNIPPGSGLSSSAALEVAVALTLLSIGGEHADLLQIAKICQRAENEFVGTRSGIMDQFASCFGRREHAMLLDCRSLEVRYVRVPGEVTMMVCNTMVRHELASGEYNARRRQCEQGVALFSKVLHGIRTLRDLTPGQFERFPALLDPLIQRRCRHVIEENQRVLNAAGALDRGDLAAFGKLMTASHESLRLDYEVSCTELDVMCEVALAVEGVYGARMTGGGFGGCVLALVKKSAVGIFRETVPREYHRRTGIQCELYECFASDGAGPIE
jgi:galactokinase